MEKIKIKATTTIKFYEDIEPVFPSYFEILYNETDLEEVKEIILSLIPKVHGLLLTSDILHKIPFLAEVAEYEGEDDDTDMLLNLFAIYQSAIKFSYALDIDDEDLQRAMWVAITDYIAALFEGGELDDLMYDLENVPDEEEDEEDMEAFWDMKYEEYKDRMRGLA